MVRETPGPNQEQHPSTNAQLPNEIPSFAEAEKPDFFDAYVQLKHEVEALAQEPNSKWEQSIRAMRNLAYAKEKVAGQFAGPGKLSSKEHRLLGTVVGTDMGEARRSIDPSIGERFDAHGIAKGDQLNALLNLLDNGVDRGRPFHTLPLRRSDDKEHASAGMGATAPYDEGGFMVVSNADSSLTGSGIALVVTNYQYREAATLLARRYPNVLFATPEGMPKALEHLIRQRSSSTGLR